MAKRLCSMTAGAERQILGYIRAGGFPHVAADAAGVPREVFADWLLRGKGRRAREPYKGFYHRIQQAIAHARITAEIDAKAKAPLHWLRSGPGRETAASPGWTGQVKPSTGNDKAVNFLLSPEWARLWPRLLKALEKFPEARIALAEVLRELDD